MIERLVVAGSVIVDLVMYVPGAAGARRRRPGRRRDAHHRRGGYNVATAAARQGLPAALAGKHGTWLFGDTVRPAISPRPASRPCSRRPRTRTPASAWCSWTAAVSAPLPRGGAEGRLTHEALAAVRPAADDAVYVSGYDLVYPHAAAVAGWVGSLRPGRRCLRPRPARRRHRPGAARRGAGRTSWLSLNGREAQLVTGEPDPTAAAAALLSRAPGLRGVVVRLGSRGALVGRPGADPVAVPGVPVAEVVEHQRRGRRARGGIRSRPWRWATRRWPPQPSPTALRLRRCRPSGLGGWGHDAAHGTRLAAPAGAHVQRRAGRVTTTQRDALDLLWPRFGRRSTACRWTCPHSSAGPAPVLLEIGFGMGDATAELAAATVRDVLAVDIHTPARATCSSFWSPGG